VDQERPGVAGPAGAGGDTEESAAGSLDDVVSRLGALGREFVRLLDVRIEQTRLGIRGAIVRTVIVLWIVLALVVVTAAAIGRVVAGLSALLAIALGSAWAGDLAAGSLLLALLALAALAIRAGLRRAGLRRLRKKFGTPAGQSTQPSTEAMS